jgi:hypothetical protein
VIPLLASGAVLVAAPLVQASDRTVTHALKPYEARLTADVGYLASFSAPSKGAAAGALGRLSKVSKHLSGAKRAASGQMASSSSGRKGRTEVLQALNDALLATGDARASAEAARAGKRSTARRDAKAEQREINKAIPLFESGGKKLHLF